MYPARLLDDVRQAAKDYESSEHRLRLAVTAARAAEVPMASIARAAGVTRQTVYNWSSDYGSATQLTVSASTALTDLPVQRPRTVKGAPVLVLSSRKRRGLLVWDGRQGKAVGYAGDELGVKIPGKIVDVIARSWALAGDSSGEGRRPDNGDLVICLDGTVGTVVASTGTDGAIDVDVDGQVSRCEWWAILLPST
jgi:DNA-binding phage protein